MAKKKNGGGNTESAVATEPVATRVGYRIAVWVIVLGLLAQFIMAFIVYPRLPQEIPSGWTGSAQPYNTVPKSVVFAMFPGFQMVILLVALFSPKDSEDQRVMQTGNVVTLVILALIFTALQASAFFINRP
ncbi:MAG: DUF1648 domain-containing protein [Armatimonadetes bacterium]|nr:DUF1648 domain-containing protein [Armatimonadota bacterium]